MSVEDRINSLGIHLPNPPAPMAAYVPVVQTGNLVLAQACGKMRKFRIRILPGDTVKLEISPYDPTRGRIVYRQK